MQFTGGTLTAPAQCGNLLELTTAWNVNAAYEHFWSPRWRTSLYGGYAAVSYNGTANTMLCITIAVATLIAGGRPWLTRLRQQLEHLVGRFAHPVERHQGLLHGRGRVVLEAAERDRVVNNVGDGGDTVTVARNGGTSRPAKDIDNWSFRFRVHRDFYP